MNFFWVARTVPLIFVVLVTGCADLDIDSRGRGAVDQFTIRRECAAYWWWTPLAVVMAAGFGAAYFRRRLLAYLAILSVISLALLVTTWVRSFSGDESVGMHRWAKGHDVIESDFWRLNWCGGGICFYGQSKHSSTADSPSIERTFTQYPSRHLLWKRSAVRWYPIQRRSLPPRPFPFWLRWGFQVRVVTRHSPPHYQTPGQVYLYSVTAPHWFLALLLSIAPALWLHKTILQLRRPKPGHCPTCGYDLRASNDCCPECGTDVPSTPPALATNATLS